MIAFTTEVSSKIPCTYVPYMLSFVLHLHFYFPIMLGEERTGHCVFHPCESRIHEKINEQDWKRYRSPVQNGRLFVYEFSLVKHSGNGQ